MAIGGDVHGRPPGRLELLRDDEDAGEREVRRRVPRVHAKAGKQRPTSDPVEAAYISVHLWAMAVEQGRHRSKSRRSRRRWRAWPSRRPKARSRSTRQPPHLEDGPHRQDPRGRASSTRSTRRPAPVEPDPYLETYTWGGEFAKEKKPASRHVRWRALNAEPRCSVRGDARYGHLISRSSSTA